MFVLIWLAVLILAVIFSWLFGFVIGWLFGQKHQKQVIYLNAIDSSWGTKNTKKLPKPRQFTNDENNNLVVENETINNTINHQEKISIWQNPIFNKLVFFNKSKKNKEINSEVDNISSTVDESEPEYEEIRTTRSKIWNIAIILIIILLSGIFAFNYATAYSYKQQADQENNSITNGEKKTDPNADQKDSTLLFSDVDMTSWIEKKLTNPNLSVKYPPNWTIKNYASDWQFVPDAINKENSFMIVADSADYPKESDLKPWTIDMTDANVKKQYDEYKATALASDISLKIWLVDAGGSPVGAYSRDKIKGTEQSRVPLLLNGLTTNKYVNVVDTEKTQYTTYFFELPSSNSELLAQIKSPIGVTEENRLFFIYNKIVRNIKLGE